MVTGAAAVPYVPARGDVVSIHFNPQAGHEQAGRRPALVLSPQAYNARVGLALICPITDQVKGYPFEVPLPDGFKVTGVVIADQVKCLDWQVCNATYVAQAPGAVVQQVRNLLARLIA